MSLLQETVGSVSLPDYDAMSLARQRLEQLTMPYWALGRLMDLAMDLAGITGGLKPAVEKRTVVVMAADHGVALSGVSKYPREVTPQMVLNFVNGGAGINAISHVVNANLLVVDMGVDWDLSDLARSGAIQSKKIARGTNDISAGPAMSREQAIACLEAGIETALELADKTDIFGTGEMGIGNTTPSSAIVSVFTGKSVPEVTGRGTGIDDGQLERKVAVVEKALQINNPDKRDALDVLAKVGGFEIGGLAGLILGAASRRKPIVIDGFISTAAALIAHALCPASAYYMIAGHMSVEPGHRFALEHLNKKPLLQLDMRLGEGTGATLAMAVVEAASRVLSEVATFEEAAVSNGKG